MKCDEIFAALAMLEKERGISQTFMMDKIVQALTTAYKRDHEGVENVVVDVDEGKRELKMFVQKEVVDEVENPGTQMSLDDAKAISAKYNVGDIVNIPVDNIEFGRIAAGNGKQVIIQGLREAESGMVYDEYNSKQHEILTGVVTRIDPRTGNASLRIGTGTEATDALLLAGEQVKGETLVEGQRIKVYLVDVRRQSRGPQVVISRTHPGLVKRLFELEARAVSCSSDLSGMPRSSGVGDRVGRYAAEIVDLKGIIEAKLQQCIYERNRLERYITTIEDSLLRQVFTYRFVNGLPWQQVAACIGGSNTADGVRMMCNRYIKATEPETDDGTEVQL